MTVNAGAELVAGEEEWQAAGCWIHWRSAVNLEGSMADRYGEGSVTFMSKAEAATTAAEAKLAMEPLPIRFLKFLF